VAGNTIPAGKKQPIVDWKPYQGKSVSEEQHKKWKQQGKYKYGIAIVMGKLWRDKYQCYYFTSSY
jgi:hypothetical protein